MHFCRLKLNVCLIHFLPALIEVTRLLYHESSLKLSVGHHTKVRQVTVFSIVDNVAGMALDWHPLRGVGRM